MKKTVFLILFIMILLPVFAIEQSSTDMTSHNSLTDNSFVILGYYKGTMETSVTFVIKDYSDNRVYQSYAEATDANNTGNNSKNIFTWTMSATTKKKQSVTVKFSFTMLQAKLGDKYYRPEYTIKMKLNQTKDSNGNNLSDEFYSSNQNSQEKTLKLTNSTNVTATKAGPSNSEYTVPANNYISYSGAVQASGNGSNSNSSWVRSGYCTLNISDYEDSVAGSYDYTCTVTVEITV